MTLNKLAGLGIASIVLFGGVGQFAINTQPVQAIQATQTTTVAAKPKSTIASGNFVKAEKATSLLGTTLINLNVNHNTQNQEIQEYQQSLFEKTPEVLSIPTAYGVPGYFSLPKGVGGEVSSRLYNYVVVLLGNKGNTQPNYTLGDALVQYRF